jgi:hypothetical protein
VKKLLLSLLLLAAPVVVAADDMDKYLEMLRSDLRTAKTTIHTEAVGLKGAEGDKFWPIQREYETELAKVQDERLKMIKQYAADYATMDDAKASALLNQALKLQDQRQALLKKYAGKISKAVSPVVAARYAQVEGFVQALVDVQVRGEVPLVP